MRRNWIWLLIFLGALLASQSAVANNIVPGTNDLINDTTAAFPIGTFSYDVDPASPDPANPIYSIQIGLIFDSCATGCQLLLGGDLTTGETYYLTVDGNAPTTDTLGFTGTGTISLDPGSSYDLSFFNPNHTFNKIDFSGTGASTDALSGSLLPASSPVPEPATLPLLAAGLLATMIKRRIRN